MVSPLGPLFPAVPGGLELLVVLLIMLALLGLPLFLLVVGGFGFWRLSREEDDADDETVEELRRRVDEMEAQLADPDEPVGGRTGSAGTAPEGTGEGGAGPRDPGSDAAPGEPDGPDDGVGDGDRDEARE